MVRNGGKDKLEVEIDALFQLPLAEFTLERNTLAARLKKEGRKNDAERVKLLNKPSVSAWAVNQLYWEHRDAFDQLIATGKRLRPMQTARHSGKAAAMRDSLDARRDALTELSELAAEVLRNAGHSPTQDTIRRIVTTLEAISAHALLADGPSPGRLTQDIDPPSFESLASLMSRAGVADEDDEPVAPSRKSGSSAASAGTATGTRQKATTTGEVRRIEEFRQAKIAAAKAALQDAKRSLSDARTTVQAFEATQKKVKAELKQAEKYRSEAEELFEKATSAYEQVAQRARTADADVEEATEAVEDAKRSVEETTKELESLLRK